MGTWFPNGKDDPELALIKVVAGLRRLTGTRPPTMVHALTLRRKPPE